MGSTAFISCNRRSWDRYNRTTIVQHDSGVILQVVTNVIEKRNKQTSFYMIRTPIQLKEIQRSAYTICLILAKVNFKNIFNSRSYR